MTTLAETGGGRLRSRLVDLVDDDRPAVINQATRDLAAQAASGAGHHTNAFSGHVSLPTERATGDRDAPGRPGEKRHPVVHAYVIIVAQHGAQAIGEGADRQLLQ